MSVRLTVRGVTCLGNTVKNLLDCHIPESSGLCTMEEDRVQNAIERRMTKYGMDVLQGGMRLLCQSDSERGEKIGRNRKPAWQCHAGFCDQGLLLPTECGPWIVKGSTCMVPYFATTKRVMT